MTDAKGIGALLASKKALVGGALSLLSTVFAGLGLSLGHIDYERAWGLWADLNKWLFGFYVAGETTNGVAATIAGAKKKDAGPVTSTSDPRAIDADPALIKDDEK